MTELIILGTAGYRSTPDRDNASFVLRSGRGAVLVDVPGTPLRTLTAAGIDPLDIEAILVTHVHTDHIYGLPALIHSLMLRDHLFRLCGSEESLDLCVRLLDVFGLRGPKYRTRVEGVPLTPGKTELLPGGGEVTAWRVPHQTSSLAFEVRLPPEGRRAVFSGDTALDPGLFERAKGADVLVHDCGAPDRFFEKYPALRSVHTSARELGEGAERAGVGLLVPVHFLTELDFGMDELEREIKERFASRLVVPRDLERFAIG